MCNLPMYEDTSPNIFLYKIKMYSYNIFIGVISSVSEDISPNVLRVFLSLQKCVAHP